MKKTTTTIIAILFFALTANAQKIAYKIDYVRPDSFFLVEHISQGFAGSPRPQEVTTALLFRDTVALTKFFDNLETERNETRAEYDKALKAYDVVAAKMDAMNIRASAIASLQKGGRLMLLPPDNEARPLASTKKK